MSTDQFQAEVLQRLTALETKLDFVIPRQRKQSKQIASLKAWRNYVVAYAAGIVLTLEVAIKAVEYLHYVPNR